jgi:Na+:H+ antiporter, NhaA family
MTRYIRNKLTTLFIEFFASEQASGIILLLCTMFAILVANSAVGTTVAEIWHLKLGFDWRAIHLQYDVEHWINDGLMAIFFLLIGLEMEREIYIGELSDLKNASLPIIAAVGGMAMPAIVYLSINYGKPTQGGFGIPMATDIAFALGILSLVGKAVPLNLKILLTALAVIDDLGAIIVIAVFYSRDISAMYLGLAAAVFLLLVIFNRIGIRIMALYLFAGVIMWYLILQSGIHAAIAGVLLAFALPFDQGEESSLSYKLQHVLHKPVAFIIMPLFALANTGLVLKGLSLSTLLSPNTLGILLGLTIGKPLGIVLFSLLAVRLGVSKLPEGIYLRELLGTGFLGGIGFTMAIFVTFLAFGDTQLAENSKLAVLVGSVVAGAIGYFILKSQHSPTYAAGKTKEMK